jgi:hypothetical protein
VRALCDVPQLWEDLQCDIEVAGSVLEGEHRRASVEGRTAQEELDSIWIRKRVMMKLVNYVNMLKEVM